MVSKVAPINLAMMAREKLRAGLSGGINMGAIRVHAIPGRWERVPAYSAAKASPRRSPVVVATLGRHRDESRYIQRIVQEGTVPEELQEQSYGRRACRSGSLRGEEKGQALTETVVVAGFVLVPLLILGVYVGKWAYLQDRTIEAARYAAWERIVWRTDPPKNREWLALKSDADLANEVRVRYFGGTGERITAVAGSAKGADAAQGASRDPLLRKHDGDPLLVERERNITVATRQEAFDGGWTDKAMKALNGLTNNPMEMTGPTVATVSATAAGLPQRLFAQVGLGNPLTFRAQAAVLTDAWTANGGQEEEKVLRGGFMKVLETESLGKIPFTGLSMFLYGLALPLKGLFREARYHFADPDANRLKIDTELQFGDRLQPAPGIPDYKGP